jgi:hypothetical protein
MERKDSKKHCSCVKQCEGDPEKIVLALDKFLKHWIGDHSECLKQGHQCEIKPRLDISTKSGKNLHLKIQKLFERFSSKAELYKDNKTTSLIECINRAITVGVDKNRDYSQTYGNRVDGQLARLTSGESWVHEIFLSFGVSLCKRSFEFLEKIDQRNTKRSKLAASPESKQKKIISTAKTKKLNKQEGSIQKKMHLKASYYNKQGNKIELEEQEELGPNVNKVDSKKPTTKKQRLCGVCKLLGHNKTTCPSQK